MTAGMYDLQLPFHWCCTHLTTVGKDVSFYSITIEIYLVSEQQSSLQSLRQELLLLLMLLLL